MVRSSSSVHLIVLAVLFCYPGKREVRAQAEELSSCPDVCLCSGSRDTYVVNCWSKGLTEFPRNVPSYTVKLYLGYNRLTNLSKSRFDGLPNLKYLNLYSNQLTTIPDGTFASLRKLEELLLGENKLTNLREGTFRGLGNLSTLSLRNNKVTYLPGGIFNSLKNLTKIELSNNGITYLPDNFFSALTKLDTLTLSSNWISNPWRLVRDLDNLVHLSLSNMSLTTIAIQQGSLRKLEYLYLDDNRITYLPVGTFSSLKNLSRLYLYRNGITYLSADIFSSLTKLEELGLGYNKISNLPETIFRGLNNLKRLYLRSNQLTHLPEGMFRGLNRLSGLYLRHNRLTHLPEGIFRGLRELYYLDLYNNSLSDLPDQTFSGLSKLGRIYLRENPFICRCSLKSILSQLKYSSVRGNFTTRVYGYCDGFDFTRKCQLERTTENVPVCPSLCSCSGGRERYTIDCNRRRGLNTIPQNMPPYTFKLSLQYNKLSNIRQGSFSNMKNLTELNIGSNDIESIPSNAFNGLRKLKSLGLQSNKISYLVEGSFRSLVELDSLHLNSNDLTSIPEGVLHGLKRLRMVNLANNQLTYLPNGLLHDMGNLQYVYLASNRLENLPEGLFRGLRLTYLDLTDNPLRCSCILHNMLKRLKEVYSYTRIRGRCNGNVDLASYTPQQMCQTQGIRGADDRDHDRRYNTANNEVYSKMLIIVSLASGFLIW